MSQRVFHGYTLDELRFRPIEHIIEALPLDLLRQVAGYNKAEWSRIRRGDRRLEDEEAAQIRRFLERELI